MLFSQLRGRSWSPFFFVTLGVLALSFALPLPRKGTIAGLPSVCTFFNITGLPCPGCGLTRSFVCLAHGHLSEAFAYHPLGPLLFGMALVYLLGTARGWKFGPVNLVTGALFALLLAFWGLRLGGVLPMPR